MNSRIRLKPRPLDSTSLVVIIGLFFATSVDARTLKIATLMPEGTSFVAEMRRAGEAIARRTDGRVKLKFYPGGVMGNDKTVMRKMRVGQLQGAALASGAMAKSYPDIEIYSLPLFFRDYDEVDYVRGRLDEKLKAGLARAGFTVPSISDGGFAYLFSQTAIRRVEDLPKAKVWIPEGDIMSLTALEIAGVSPIALPTADVYTGLQTGLIDTAAAPPMGAIAFQWHSKVSYMTNVPLMYLTGIFAFDSKALAKLLPEDQAIVREEIASASERLDTETRLSEANAVEALKRQGIEFVMASSDEEIERWHNISAQALDRLRGLNRYSEELLDEMIEHLETFRARKRAAPSSADAKGELASSNAPPSASPNATPIAQPGAEAP